MTTPDHEKDLTMTTKTPTIEKITETDPMIRTVNKDLMVGWINADLFKRANNDVRHSVVFYEENKIFLGAIRLEDPTDAMAHITATEGLLESLWNDGVRYWSVGIV